MSDSIYAAFLIVFIVAFTVALLTMPISIYLSHKWGIVSQPGGRRQEDAPMPKLGGSAIFMGFTVAIIVAQFLNVPRFDDNEITRLLGLIIGGTFIYVVGIIDDKYELSYIPLFFAQFFAASTAIVFQIFIEFFNNPFTGQQTDPWSPLVTIALTLFWMVLMMNTTNFLDGLDGLAAGVAFIAGTMLFMNSAFRLEPPQLSVSLLPLALMGACLGFLLYNFHPAKVYMGGTALYLGYTLASLSIIGGAKIATILLVMGLPLMDLVWQAGHRLLKGRNPFQGDRGHIHFRLQDSGLLSYRQIVVSYYVFCAFFGILTLFLESQIFKAIAFGVMLLLIVLGFLIVIRRQATTQSSDDATQSKSMSSS
jgi:UDP-GlcNAc:undecaprenyl-phosphate GlcNAc-1-phosphate transferase